MTGMSKAAHLTDEQFARFQHRTLEPAELLDVDDHLTACAECRDRLFVISGAMAQLAGLRSELSEHLDYDQIVAGAEGTADAGVSGHLAECAMCLAEVEDLRQFQGELKRAENHVVEMPVRKTAARKLAYTAAIAAGLIMSASLAFRLLRPEPSTPAPQIARNAPPAEPALTPGEQAAVQLALSTHSLERAPVLDRLIARRGVLLGAPGESKTFAVSAPVGTVVLNDRPLFRWEAVPRASKYVVAVFDDNFQKVAESPALTDPEWRPEQPLARGRIYNWQVTAHLGGATLRSPVPPAPEARFQVALAEVAEQAEQARRQHPENHLLLAVLLAKAGALDGAAAELDVLAGTDAATAQALRESLERIRKR